MTHKLRDGQLLGPGGAMERVEAVHGDVRVPLAAVTGADIVDEPIRAVHGLRWPGAALPGVLAVGTFIDGHLKTFAAVHHAAPRGILMTLAGADFDQVIVGVDDPDAVLALLRANGIPPCTATPSA